MENKNLKEELLDFYRKYKIGTWTIGFFIVVLFICSIINILYSISYMFFLNEKIDGFGLIGDSAGLLNSLFSGLAFLGVIITVFLQSKELKQTTTELKNQKIEFEKQNQTLKRQQFEKTFFNLLKTQENIISNLNIETIVDIKVNGKIHKDIPQNVKSKQVFEYIFKDKFLNISNNTCFNLKNIKLDDIARDNYESMQYSLKNNTSDLISNNNSEYICKEVVRYFNFREYDLSNYFTFVYRIIKFVDDANFSEFIDFSKEELKNENKKTDRIHKEKSEYVDIVRAMLSTYEIFMLFFNGLTQNKMKNLIITYQLFNNINYDLLKGNIYLYKLYISKNDKGELISAYGDRLKEIEENESKIFDEGSKDLFKN